MSLSLKQEEPNIRVRFARPYISNAVFYIPFGYYYAVRLGTIPKLVSWMLIYLMPTAFYSALAFEGTWWHFGINYLLILLATFSLYEYGYIFNDTIAIRHEKQPALRLYDYNFAHFNRWHPLILGVRIAYTVIALLALHAFNAGDSNVFAVDGAVGLTGALFMAYNYCRGRHNVWLYPFLVCSRYLPFMLLYHPSGLLYLLLFLSFPLLNAIERFSMPRYRWPFMQHIIPDEASKTRFRMAYYLIVLAVLGPAMYMYGDSLIPLIPIALLGIYRLSLFFWLKRHNPTNYLNG